MRITTIERRPRRRLIDLYIDDELALTISTETCVQFGLRSGIEVSPERLDEVRQAEARHTAMKAALRLLSYSPRSERELRNRLKRKSIDAAVVDGTVARLREVGLIDDAAYATTFVEGRNRTSPRSRRMIEAELRSKGVNGSTAEESAALVDEEDAAYRAGARKARSLSKLGFQDFRRRLGDFLVRRGFDYETAGRTVSRLWSEREGFDATDGTTRE